MTKPQFEEGSPSPSSQGADPHRVEIEIGNDLRERQLIDAAVARLVARHRISPDAAADISIAIDEALVNVIRHAYRDADTHRIRVRLAVVDGTFEAEIDDDGIAFDPLSVPAPDVQAPLEKRSVGGLGIHLMRRLMTRISYRREAGRNRLTLVKQFG